MSDDKRDNAMRRFFRVAGGVVGAGGGIYVGMAKAGLKYLETGDADLAGEVLNETVNIWEKEGRKIGEDLGPTIVGVAAATAAGVAVGKSSKGDA